ncbi:MAG: hypothetical protein J1E63_00755 [Muribaculaceae bacterium]|nr:hypothetical protein [Muribaculaceae bacterium]
MDFNNSIANILRPVTTTRANRHEWRLQPDAFDDDLELFEQERLALKANVLYVHGFASSGNSGTAATIQKYLPNCRVIAPDLPIDPNEALMLLRKIIAEQKVDVVVGTSMGGMFAQKLRGIPKVLVNPSFHVSESMKNKIGVVPFFKKRQDGASEFEVTPQLCDAYKAIETPQFDNIDEHEKSITYGLFGTEDDVINCEEEYSRYYPKKMIFFGGHRLSEKVIHDYVIEAILILLQDKISKSNLTSMDNQ